MKTGRERFPSPIVPFHDRFAPSADHPPPHLATRLSAQLHLPPTSGIMPLALPTKEMEMRIACAVVLLSIGMIAGSAFAAEELTYVDLVKRLTDLERLATLPQPGETCAQWSSWDRKSKYDAATDKYIAWDANGDGQGFIRREGD